MKKKKILNQPCANMSTLTFLFLPTACNHFCATGYPPQPGGHCILLKPDLFSIHLIVCFEIAQSALLENFGSFFHAAYHGRILNEMAM